jgi:uncharacterized membrane protein SpoIIM required for sporulation
VGERARSRFDRRREQWLRLSELLVRVEQRGLGDLADEELSELGRLHRSVSSHLAQARGGQADPEVLAYLNGLVGRSHNAVYRPRSALKLAGLLQFLWSGFPRMVWKLWPYVVTAAILMYGMAILAYVVTLADPTYAHLFVPAQFLSAAGPFEKPEALKEGLGLGQRGLLSGYIMQNNIKVGFTAFAGGVLAGTLTVGALLQTGAMVGGLAGAVAHYSDPLPFYALLIPHGVIELWAIVLCGAAGLRLAKSIILPGRLTRKAALREGGREAVLVALGAALLFVVAALIEGFITPSAMPDLAKLWVGGISGIAMFLYLYWPWGRPVPAPDASAHA